MQKVKNNLQGRLFFLLRLLVSLGLMIYLCLSINWAQARESIVRSDKILLMTVPFITLGGLMLSALRWKTILVDSQVHFPWFKAFRGYVLGLFYGTFLPGVLGGDAIRIALCIYETRCSAGISAAAVLLERIGGVISLFCLLFFVNITSPNLFSVLLTIQDHQLISAVGICGLVGVLVMVATRSTWLRPLPDSSSGSIRGKIMHFLYVFVSTFGSLKNRSLLVILVYCILFQTFDIFATFVLSRAIGLQLNLLVFFIVIPLTYLVLMLPFSLGGLGLREGTMAFLLSHFGVSFSDAVMLSFLIYLNRMLIGLLGGTWQMIGVMGKDKAHWNAIYSSLRGKPRTG